MGRMKQLWSLTAFAVVAVLAAGYFFGIKAQAGKVDTLNDSRQSQLSANKALSAEIARLEKQKSGVAAQNKRLRAIEANIPDNPALPSLIRSLAKIEDASNVTILSITPALPAVGTAANPAAPAPAAKKAPAAGEASGGKAADTAKKKDAAAGSADKPAPAASAAKAPVATLAGQLVSIPVTLTVTGEFAGMQLFLAGLEELPRSLVVGQVAIKAVEEADDQSAVAPQGSLESTLQAVVFMKAPAAPIASAPKAAAVAPAEK